MGGGGWICFLVIFGDFMREIKSFIFSPQNRLEIFISIFILYLFQRPLWITYLFPPCFNCGQLFISPNFVEAACGGSGGGGGD